MLLRLIFVALITTAVLAAWINSIGGKLPYVAAQDVALAARAAMVVS